MKKDKTRKEKKYEKEGRSDWEVKRISVNAICAETGSQPIRGWLIAIRSYF